MPPKKVSLENLIERRTLFIEQLTLFENFLKPFEFEVSDKSLYETLSLKFERIKQTTISCPFKMILSHKQNNFQ